MLWGRLGYDPDLSTDVIKNHLKLHFPEASSDDIYEAWKTAIGGNHRSSWSPLCDEHSKLDYHRIALNITLNDLRSLAFYP